MARSNVGTYLAVAGIVALLAGLSTPATASAATLSFVPIADAQVNSGNVNGNYGTLATIRTREGSGSTSDPTYRSFLRFDISGVSGQTVSSVTLRLFVTDASPNGQGVHRVASTTWGESSVTYANAPAIDAAAMATAPVPTAGAYRDIALPASAITGNGPVSFALKSVGNNSAMFSSGESSNPPRLVIVTGGTPTPTPTPTPTSPPAGVPVGAFSANPTSGMAPLTVTFTDQSTNGPTSWSWNFGDPGSGSQNTSSARNPSHTFASAGSYTVTLTPRNGSGAGSPVTHPISVTTPGGSGDPVLVGAGDIADCSRTQDEATATLLDGISGTVFTAGDNVYENGTASEFTNCYGPNWGRHKSRTRPGVGNHEYQTSGASGYYGYFGAAAGSPSKGYYSFDIGAWHAVMLNSNCSKIGGCGATSAQATWLRADLAAHPAACTVAIWHHPRFTSSRSSPDGLTTALWQALYDAGADLIIGGHYHNYERFSPQTPAGATDNSFGIREIVVGTGGAGLAGFGGGTMAHSVSRSSSAFGVLKLTLHQSSYDFRFVPIAGQTFADSGTASCHGAPSGAAIAKSRAATDRELRAWARDVVRQARSGRPTDVVAGDLRDATSGAILHPATNR